MADLQAVLFDLDGTLLDRAGSLRLFLAAQWASQPALQAVPEADFTAAFVTLDANGAVWKDAVYQMIIDRFAIAGIGAEVLLQQYVEEFRNHARLFPGVGMALDSLRMRGLKLGIVTNGPTGLQQSGVAACGLVPLMNVVVISDREGVAKPNPEIFRRALSRMAVSAARSVFVGDNPVADIKGAHDAGMKTVWLENPYFPPPVPDVTDAVLGGHSDLPACIARL